MSSTPLKDHNKEQMVVHRRLHAAFFLSSVFFLLLLVRLFDLQIIKYEKLSTDSDGNRILVQSIPPTRGLIYDVNGELLATNRPSKSLTIVPEQVKDISTLIDTINQLIFISASERKRFFARLKRRKRPFTAIPLKEDLSDSEVAKVSVNQFRLEGVAIKASLVRFYPKNKNFAHAVGYVGRLTERELKVVDSNIYTGINVIGKIGLEKYYEPNLVGVPGYQKVEINARGRILRVLEKKPPKSGKNIHLYLDSGLQQASIKALDGRRGAVVAMDPKTGGVLAMVSNPSFDPNLFVTGINYKTYNALNSDIEHPLYNRATLGEYPPASTIKPFVGLALLHYGVVDTETKVFDKGWYQLPNNTHRYRNWNRRGDGWINLHQALVRSNDTFFYNQALKLGIDRYHDFLSEFGLGDYTGVDIHEERSGLLPSTKWKRKKYNKTWYPGESVIAIIGQGYNLTTPIQLAEGVAILANRGRHVQPHLAKRAADLEPSVYMKPETDKKNWALVVDAMKDVVSNPKGTAYWRIGKGLKYTMAGKTGTAQVVAIAQGEKYNAEQLKEFQRDHSLFIAFAPVDNPKIAIAVVVENNHGATNVAKIIVDYYLNFKNKEQ